MGNEPVVHLIARRESDLGALLEAALGGGTRVRYWTTAPPSRQTLAPGEQVVVDLTGGEPRVRPDAVARLAEAVDVWLVTGVHLISGQWSALARDPRVRVVSPGSGPDGLAGLVEDLERQMRAPSGDEVATLVLDRTPAFAPVAAFVKAVCEQPWRIRRPCDLALAVDVSRNRLLQSCRALGFERVEHFITAVRMVALSLLTAERGVPLGAARRSLGITDPSNARRQLERAKRRSAAGLGQLQGLVA